MSDRRLIAHALVQSLQDNGLTATHLALDDVLKTAALPEDGCIVVDLTADAPGTLEVCAQVRSSSERTLVLLLTGDAALTTDVIAAIGKHRPDGMLCADVTAATFVEALQMLLRGHLVYLVDGDLRRVIIEQTAWQASTAGSPRRLDPDQVRLLAYVAQGRSDAEIASILHISLATARRRIADLRRETETTNRVSLAAWAGAHGIR